MKKMLVTGGTVFVSRYVAEYFAKMNYEVFVLNRNTRPQSDGVKLIKADRCNLGDVLRNYHFDIVLDITAYNENDINLLVDALGSFDEYIMISSSAVYPDYGIQPFTESCEVGENKYWGKYGTNKISAERALLSRVPDAYILRPPYLYGQMNNVYREAFVFDCALNNRKFYIPQDGKMKLQFFHVDDLCRFIKVLLYKKPRQHIFNVGNEDAVSIKDWVTICYNAVGKSVDFVSVDSSIDQRAYFSFYDYEYQLDVSMQYELMPDTKSLEDGVKESFEWYVKNQDKVNKKPLIDFIDNNLM